MFFLGFIGHVFYLAQDARYRRMGVNWAIKEGAQPSSTGLEMYNNRPIHQGVPFTHIWVMFYAYLGKENIVVNPVYKQNYRLYLDKMPFEG